MTPSLRSQLLSAHTPLLVAANCSDPYPPFAHPHDILTKARQMKQARGEAPNSQRLFSPVHTVRPA